MPSSNAVSNPRIHASYSMILFMWDGNKKMLNKQILECDHPRGIPTEHLSHILNILVHYVME